MPTEWEQHVVELYVTQRKLVRPDTDIKKALISIAFFILVTSGLVWVVHYVFFFCGIVAHLAPSVLRFYNEYRFLSILCICAIVIFFEAIFFSKYALIGMIKLYQHYAPEEIRRRCLFMPTCSEYAILAIQKYGVIIGLCKSYYRLMFLCRGNIFQIHYPWDKVCYK